MYKTLVSNEQFHKAYYFLKTSTHFVSRNQSKKRNCMRIIKHNKK